MYKNITGFYIGLWCNGNTQDFGPWIMGSNPVSPTILEKKLKKLNIKLKIWYFDSILNLQQVNIKVLWKYFGDGSLGLVHGVIC